jgi:hypothetical protein
MEENWVTAATSVAGFIVIFPIFWCAIVVLISRVSGWARLAERYHTNEAAQGPAWRFESASMRWNSRYGNIVTLSAEAQGLRIALFPLFRPGHPPLLVPWNEISARPASFRVLFRTPMELRFARAPEIPFCLRETAFLRIQAAAGGHLRLTTPNT